MRVSCDETHLHYIQPYQFVDSPEWEANREQSDDVFQVIKGTINIHRKSLSVFQFIIIIFYQHLNWFVKKRLWSPEFGLSDDDFFVILTKKVSSTMASIEFIFI